jgi:hypothetical protein
LDTTVLLLYKIMMDKLDIRLVVIYRNLRGLLYTRLILLSKIMIQLATRQVLLCRNTRS